MAETLSRRARTGRYESQSRLLPWVSLSSYMRGCLGFIVQCEDVGVIIRHLVENFVHALKKEIPSAFLRATGKRLRIEAATSMRVYYRRTGCSA